MGLLTDRDQQQVRKEFESLDQPLTLLLFIKEDSPLFIPGAETCPTCKDAKRLLEEVAALSDKIQLDIHDVEREPEVATQHGIDRVPAIVVQSPGVRGRMRYFGLPSGYEFAVLLTAIIDASRSVSGLAQETIDTIRQITDPLHLQVFVTPT